MLLEPESLYRIVPVSCPIVDGEGRVFFIASRHWERGARQGLAWLRRGRESWLLEGRLGPVATGPDGLLAAVKRGEDGDEIVLVEPDSGSHWLLARVPGRILELEWGPGFVAFTRLTPRGPGLGERRVILADRLPLYADGVGWLLDQRREVGVVWVPSGRIERVSPERVEAGHPTVDPGSGRLYYVAWPDPWRPWWGQLRSWTPRGPARGELVLERFWIEEARAGPGGVALRGGLRERGVASHARVYLAGERGRLECLTCDAIDYNISNNVLSDSRGPGCGRLLQWGPSGRLYFPVHVRGAVELWRVAPGGDPEPVVEGRRVVDEYSVCRRGLVLVEMRSTVPPRLGAAEGGGVRVLLDYNTWLSRLLEEPVHHAIPLGEDGALDYWVLPASGAGDCRGCVPWALYIHGGPKAAWGEGFMLEHHLISQSGVALVLPNPRGSDGYSEDYADIRGRLGTVDADDILRAARDALRRHPELSPSRAAVMGGSYGGWMTAYLIGRTGMFRSAIAMRGCSDWASFYGASDIGWWFAPDLLGADPWEDPELYVRLSPVYSAGSVRAETLIIHSAEDYRCPLDQALTLYAALRRAGARARLAVFPGEGHDLSRSGRPDRRVERLRLILEWLCDTLGGRRGAEGG